MNYEVQTSANDMLIPHISIAYTTAMMKETASSMVYR